MLGQSITRVPSYSAYLMCALAVTNLGTSGGDRVTFKCLHQYRDSSLQKVDYFSCVALNLHDFHSWKHKRYLKECFHKCSFEEQIWSFQSKSMGFTWVHNILLKKKHLCPKGFVLLILSWVFRMLHSILSFQNAVRAVKHIHLVHIYISTTFSSIAALVTPLRMCYALHSYTIHARNVSEFHPHSISWLILTLRLIRFFKTTVKTSSDYTILS